MTKKKENPHRGGRPMKDWKPETMEKRRIREQNKPITPPSYHKKKELLESITDDFERY